MTKTTNYIARRPIGIDMETQGIAVHVAGGHINNHYGRRIRTEVDEKIELELYVSDYDGKQTWIQHLYYSPTQAKTRESRNCPAQYADIGQKLEAGFEEIFGPLQKKE